MSKRLLRLAVVLTGVWMIALTGVRPSAAMKCNKSSKEGHEEMSCSPCQWGGCADRYLDMADDLNLSEAQVSKLKEIRNGCEKLKIQKKAEMEIIKLDIEAMLDEAKPDQSKLDAQVDKMSQIKAGLMKECIKASIQARQVLTPEQYKQAKQSKKTDKVCPQHKKSEEKPSSTPKTQHH